MMRIETLGSVWEIDEVLMQYRRFPNREAPRAKPEWSDERAGMLQDFVWHPYDRWEITDTVLRIFYDGRFLRAPQAVPV